VLGLPHVAACRYQNHKPYIRRLPQEGCDGNKTGAQQVETWMPSMQEKTNKGKQSQYISAFILVGKDILEEPGLCGERILPTRLTTTRAATLHVCILRQRE
jgi:hypothetical protein